MPTPPLALPTVLTISTPAPFVPAPPVATPAAIKIGPESEPAELFDMAGAVRGPVAYGPRVTHGDPPVPLAVRHYKANNLNAQVTLLTESKGRQWQEQLNEVGSGKVQLQNDDPALTVIAPGDVLRFELHGWAAFAFIVRELEQVTVADGPELTVTTLSGPGILALLDTAVVYPARRLGSKPIEEDRLFSWVSVDFDDSAWRAATNLALVKSNTPAWHGVIESWPDNFAHWVWVPGATVRLAPGGTCYFRETFYVGEETRVLIYFVADDFGELWIDGTHVRTSPQWGNQSSDVQAVESVLSEGWHVVAVSVSNSAVPADIGGPFNPAGFACSIYTMTADGVVAPEPFIWTDNNWNMVAYPPSPPGMTPGEVIRHVVQEAQLRGALAPLTLNFTDEVDSDGVPWPEVTDIATKVGTDLLTFLRELSGTYIDFWMEPASWTLWAWVRDGRGDDQPVALTPPVNRDPATGNLKALTHKGT